MKLNQKEKNILLEILEMTLSEIVFQIKTDVWLDTMLLHKHKKIIKGIINKIKDGDCN